MAFNKSFKVIYNPFFVFIVAKTSNIFSGGEYLLILFSYSPLKISDKGGCGDIEYLLFMKSAEHPETISILGIRFFSTFIFIINLNIIPKIKYQ
jgi:hypothetical protein